MPKVYYQHLFQITPELSVICHTEDTRYGFRHLAQALLNGNPIGNPAKACYYNRTWEAYQYQSVLRKLTGSEYGLLAADRQAIADYAQ